MGLRHFGPRQRSRGDGGPGRVRSAAMTDAGPLELTSAQRKTLRRLAHDLRPVVQIGEAGLTDRVLAALEDALAIHELIKVKINHDRDERREMAERAARDTGSALAGSVGRISILYRPSADPEQRSIDLVAGRRRAPSSEGAEG